MTSQTTPYIARISGAPAEMVDAFDATFQATFDLLCARDRVTGALTAESRRFSDLAHEVIPRLSDSKERASLLAARRGVHRGDYRRLDRVAHLTPPQGQGPWSELLSSAATLQELDQLRSSLDNTYEQLNIEQHQELPGRLIKSFRDSPRLMGSLALASPTFYRVLRHRHINPAPHNRQCRSVISYATRIVTKPSPFGAFCDIGFPTQSPAPGTYAPKVMTTRPYVATLLAALALWDLRQGNPPAVRVATGVTQVDGRWTAVVSQRYWNNQLFGRLDEVVSADSTAVPEDPDSTAQALGQQLLVPAPVWSATTTNDLAALRDALDAGNLGGPAPVRELISRMAGDVEELDTADADQRLYLVERLRRDYLTALDELKYPAPPWTKQTPLVHENASRQIPLEGGPGLPLAAADLTALRSHLQQGLMVSAEYEQIVSSLVRHYGHGFQRVSLLEVLYRLVPAMRQLRTQVDSTPAGDRWQQMCRSGSVLPPYWTAFVQPAQEQGRALSVVNQVHTGGIGLLGRWCWLPGGQQSAEQIAQWIRGLGRGSRVLSFTCWSDWVDIQRVSIPGLERVSLPGDGTDDGSSIWSELTLNHTDMGLQILDGSNHSVVFAYLGTVPAVRLSGVARVLDRLSFPWAAHDPGLTEPGSRLELPDSDVIWRRATWLVPPDLREVAQESLLFHRQVVSWAQSQQVPPELFATSVVEARPAGKPQWVHLGSPHTVELLRQMVLDGSDVVVAEALPGSTTRPEIHGTSAAAEFTLALEAQ